MLVPDHKGGVAGEAGITFIPSVQACMEDNYLKFLRLQFGVSDKVSLFLTSDGSSFTRDTICRPLPKLWKKSQIHRDLRVDGIGVSGHEGGRPQVR